MSYIEVLSTHNLTVDQWNDTLFREYLRAAYWTMFSGTSANAAVHMVEDLSKGKGDNVILGLRTQLVGGVVTGNNTGIGNEGTFDLVDENITIDNVRVLAKVKDVPMTQKRTMFNILNEAKLAIVEKAQARYDDEITTELSSRDNGRVQGRMLYGSADSNYNATHATALATVDNTADKMSTTIIEILKRKAQIPVNAVAKMRPIRVITGKGKQEWFTLHIHPYAARDLKQDPAWRNAHLNLPPQSNANSPIYTGAEWIGAWEGVQIYNYEGISLETNSNSVQCAVNLFLGAQAIGVAWGQRSKWGEEPSDVGHNMTYETHEIRGMERLVFSRSTPENQGCIHSYTAAVAD